MPSTRPFLRRSLVFGVFCLLVGMVAWPLPAAGQGAESTRIQELERQVRRLEGEVQRLDRDTKRLERESRQVRREVEGAGAGGVALFVAAVFCALWAQNTGRSAWLWFFLGLFCNVIALIFLLVKNSEDLSRGARPDGKLC